MKKINYREKLKLYLELRWSLGIQTGQFKSRLETFIEYLEETDDGTKTHAEMAFDWASNTPSQCQLSTRSTWLSYARMFLRYLKGTHPEVELPGQGIIVSPRRGKPYIFSTDEIVSLIKCAGNLAPANSIRPYTHQTLLGLLACTGMRPGEVVRLKKENVYLEEAVPRLYIEKTKFDRSRWVVLHPSATQKLQLYSQRRRDFGFENNEAFFLNLKGKQVEGRNLRHAFEKLLKSAAITCSQGARAPSLHSFRHTFAVDRLKHWYEQNADIRNLLPHLSVYMGHVDLEGTYWYLTATPELMVSAGQLFEHYAKGEQNELQK